MNCELFFSSQYYTYHTNSFIYIRIQISYMAMNKPNTFFFLKYEKKISHHKMPKMLILLITTLLIISPIHEILHKNTRIKQQRPETS